MNMLKLLLVVLLFSILSSNVGFSDEVNTVKELAKKIRTINNTDERQKLRAELSRNVPRNSEEVELLLDFADDENQDIQFGVISALRELKDQQYAPVFRKRIKNGKYYDRLIAINKAGELKDNEAVDQLLYSLDDVNRDIRTNSYKSLSKIGDKRSFAPMVKKFKIERDFVARTDILSSEFSRLQDKLIYNQLIDSLAHDLHPDVRASAARALGSYKDKATEDILMKAFQHENHTLVRFYAVLSLGNMEYSIDLHKKLDDAIKQEKDELLLNGLKIAIKKLGNSKI